jgi:hypothetical protein
MSATTSSDCTKTGFVVDVWGTKLPEIDRELGDHDTICVDGVWYYTWDFGGFIVGSRQATSTDFGGNDAGRGTRTAPEFLQGMAATQGKGTRPTRVKFSTPEIVGAGHRA